MPVNYSRRLTGRVRTAQANRHLGVALAFVAGAINAGGFLAIHQYTSHMTGVVSSMADNVAMGTFSACLTGIAALSAFVTGAASSALLVNFSRQRGLHSEFALPLLFEAMLLLCFGLVAPRVPFEAGWSVALTAMLLSFIMGLQNAVITKLSNAEIRTTHVTGIVTDIGIELGKLAYRNAPDLPAPQRVVANRPRLKILSLLLLFFFMGGVAGALGFHHVGYVATVPLALVLVALVSAPVLDDMRVLARRAR